MISCTWPEQPWTKEQHAADSAEHDQQPEAEREHWWKRRSCARLALALGRMPGHNMAENLYGCTEAEVRDEIARIAPRQTAEN